MGRRVAVIALSTIAGILFLIVAALFVLSSTDWGRERVRRLAISQIRATVSGEVKVGRLDGNLLDEIRLIGVSIVDSAGRPFLRADTLESSYQLRALLSRRILLSDVRIVNAVIVLDQPPGEDWSFVRIFRSQPRAEPGPSTWGRWVELRDITLVDTRITMRTAWEPPPDLSPAEEREAIRMALSGEMRDNVIQVGSGYQNVMDFRNLNAQLARVLVAHPDTAAIPIDVTRFSGIARPFNPPEAHVRDLSGSFRLQGDTLYFRNVVALLTNSRLAGDGFYSMEHADLLLRLEGSPVALNDLRWLNPSLPEEGGGTLDMELWLRPTSRHIIAREMDLRVGQSELRGHVDLLLGDTVRVRSTNLQFARLDTRLMERLAPDVNVPRHGLLTGSLALDGPPAALQLEADVQFDEAAGGTSRVAARGGIDLEDEPSFHELRLRLHPLRTSLVRAFQPDFPLGGEISGTSTLNGSPSGRLAFVADLVHVEAGERSRVTGGGNVAMTPAGRFDVDLRLHPLSLRSAGKFAPQADLRGYAAGRLTVEGTMRDLRLNADFDLGEGGLMQADGRLDLASAETVFDLRLAVDDFNPSAMSERVPATTSLSGIMLAEGRGLEPATMRARVQADLEGIAVDVYEADQVHLRLDIDHGMATFDTSWVRTRAAKMQVEGSFGLVAGREGQLAYSLVIDSLDAIAPSIQKKPDARGEAVASSVGTALHEAAAPAGNNRRETVASERTDSLGGRLEASGTLRGHIGRFDADGRAVLNDFTYGGTFVRSGEIEYTLADVGLEEVDVTLDASFDSLLLAGHSINAAAINATYRGARYGAGDVAITVQRDEESDLRADLGFMLSLERNELRLAEMDVRLDSVRWSTTGTAAFYWGANGVTVEDFDLRSDAGERIFLNGDLPIEGPADLEIAVNDVDVATVSDLLQLDLEASGLISLEARIEGSMQNPQIEGEATLLNAFFDGRAVPDVRADFSYANDEARADAVLVHDSVEVASAEAHLPIHLAFGDGTPQLLERPMRIDVRGERIPLDVLPSFTDQVEAVAGTISLNLSITGTPENTTAAGDLSLDLETLHVVPLGVGFDPVVGRASFSDGVLRIDSLVAYSGGAARITGDVRLESLANPVFDLELDARDTRVMDTKDARLQVDADLTIQGPLDSINVSGLVRTRRGVIYVPEMSEFGPANVVNLDDPGTAERLDSLLLSDLEVVTQRPAMFENVQADVEVEINRDVWLRSTEANVEIYTPSDSGPLRVRMRGLRGMPSIEGTINTDRGEYEYMSRRFTLTRGAVTFLGGEEVDPLLQLAAEHQVQIPGREALTIRIVVGGTMRDLEITFESNAQPPISESDLLSFLAFGRETSSLIQGEGSSVSGQATGGGLVGNVAGMAMRQVTAIALESMITELEAEIGQDLGLDVIRITPAPMPADLFTSSYLDVLRGTEFEAGRYLTSRLFVAAQARPARTLPGVRLEYRTRRDFEWSASWRSRFLPGTPTLSEPKADRVGVFGTFLFKEWRF